jgi:hypothetical protein
MAKLSTVRRCPYCAEPIKLGDCPIVATEFPNAEFLPGEKISLKDIKLPSEAELKGQLKTGWPIVAEPPSDKRSKGASWGSMGGRSHLGSIFELTAREDLPARACPACEFPLPQSIDERQALVIGVVGVNRVGKTHLLASCLTQASRQRGLTRTGCSDFALDESTAKRFREEYYEPLFRRGQVLRMSQAAAESGSVRFRPLVFNATLPNLGEVSLILHDVAGELMADPRARTVAAPYLRGAKGIIFVVDPREIDGLRPGLPDWILQSNPVGFDQGALLSACLRSDGIVDRGKVIPVAIALAKADLLPQVAGRELPFLAPAPMQEEPSAFVQRIKQSSRQVAQFLEEHGAYDILDPASEYGKGSRNGSSGSGRVTFHAFSALGSAPDGDDNLHGEVKPLNCIDPLAAVLAQVQMSNR